jgi:hypothetical protein
VLSLHGCRHSIHPGLVLMLLTSAFLQYLRLPFCTSPACCISGYHQCSRTLRPTSLALYTVHQCPFAVSISVHVLFSPVPFLTSHHCLTSLLTSTFNFSRLAFLLFPVLPFCRSSAGFLGVDCRPDAVWHRDQHRVPEHDRPPGIQREAAAVPDHRPAGPGGHAAHHRAQRPHGPRAFTLHEHVHCADHQGGETSSAHPELTRQPQSTIFLPQKGKKAVVCF